MEKNVKSGTAASPAQFQGFCTKVCDRFSGGLRAAPEELQTQIANAFDPMCALGNVERR